MERLKNLRISLVIPVYNEASTIEKCLETVFTQNIPFYEVFVVDNNSTDETITIASKFDVKIIHESSQGVVYARDAGFHSATGEVIGRIDADSLLEPNWTEELNRVFSDNSIDAVTGPVYYHDMPGRTTGQLADTFIRSSLDKLSNKVKFLFGSNMAIRTSVWKSVSGLVCHEKSYHEDLDLAIHLVESGHQILLDKKLVAGVSSRRVEGSTAEFRKYMRMFSATYKGHDIREPTITIPIIIYWSLYPSMRLLRGAYDQETGRISLEKLLLGTSNARANPGDPLG